MARPPVMPMRSALGQSALRRSVTALGSVLFPRLCPITGERLGEGAAFSPHGWACLQQISAPQCRRCGLPFDAERRAADLCGACAAPHRFPRNLCGPKRLDAVRSALVYERNSARLVLELKYGDRHDHAASLSRLLVSPLRSLGLRDPLLLPVPLHPQRLRHRRFNQAAVLAQHLAKGSGHDVDFQLLKRIKPTASQKGRGFEARFRNLQGAFQARETLDRTVVIIDDVLTSGATLVGCAGALRKAGAERVFALTVARAIPNAKDADIDLPEA